jgi:Dimerisation domain
MNPLQALNRLTDIATSFCVSQMFVAACTLGVFDQLAGGATSADELGKRLDINRNSLSGNVTLPGTGVIQFDQPAQIGGTLTTDAGLSRVIPRVRFQVGIPVTTQGLRSLDGTARFHHTPALVVVKQRVYSTRCNQVKVQSVPLETME